MCAVDLRPQERAAYRHTGTKRPCTELGNTQKETHRFPNACDERLPIRTLGEGATAGASGTKVPPERRWTPAMHEFQGYKVGHPLRLMPSSAMDIYVSSLRAPFAEHIP